MKQTYLIKTKPKTSVLSQVSPPVILLLRRQEGDGWIQGQLGYVLETLDYKNDCVMLLFLHLDPFSNSVCIARCHNATSSGVTHDYGDPNKSLH